MNLYLIRHGDAEPEEVDPQRPLSRRGLTETGKIASFLKRLDLPATRVWHSGKTRAHQTATLIAPVFSCPQPVQHPGLDPRDDPRPLVKLLARARRDLVLVGHLPQLSLLASLLLTHEELPDVLLFEESSVACLTRQADTWSLLWMFDPHVLP